MAPHQVADDAGVVDRQRQDRRQHRGAEQLQQHVGQHVFRRRAHDHEERRARAVGRTGPANRREASGNSTQRDQRGGDQRDLRQHQGLDRAGQDLLGEDRPEPGARAGSRSRGRGASPLRSGARDDVVGHEADEAGEPSPSSDGLAARASTLTTIRIGTVAEPHPEPARADQRVEHEEQRAGLGVAALPEGGFEVEAHGRQADEAEHQGRAHGAFEPVERVVPEGGGDAPAGGA